MAGQVTVQGDNLVVRFPYNPDHVAAVKRINGRTFSKVPEPHWKIPATPWHAQRTVEELGKLGFNFEASINRLIAEHKRGFRPMKGSHEQGEKNEHGLYPFQEAAVEFIDYANGRALIGDEMGLGKTVMALSWANRQTDIDRVLVVAPANVVWKWKDECETWLEHMTAGVVEGYTAPRPDTDVLIMSYNVMTNRYLELQELLDENASWLIILDECHYIKNHKAKRTKVAKKLAMGVPYLLMLSGTPFLNRPIELFNSLNILDSTAWNSAWQYGNRYCGGANYRGGFFQGATNLEELRDRLQTIMIRRLKVDVLEQLPELTRSIIPVSIPEYAEYMSLQDEMYDAIRGLSTGSNGYYANALARINKLRHAVGLGKSFVAGGWAKDFLEENPDEKLVLYAHHLNVVDRLVHEMEPYGVGSITGRVKLADRHALLDAFQREQRPRVMVINEAGGQGVDMFSLSSARSSTILFVEREWTPALEEQAEARLHRMGQKYAVHAYYLVARGTIDEDIAGLIEMKRRIIKDVLGQAEVDTSIVGDLLAKIRGRDRRTL